MVRYLALATLLVSAAIARAEEARTSTPDYASRVEPILRRYCVGCHNDDDREGDFSLEGDAPWRDGTSHGPLVKSGDSGSSLLVRQMTGQAKPAMPPKGKPKPTEAEIASIRAWIDAGARIEQAKPADRLALNVPVIASKAKVRPILALDASRDGRWLATARYGIVEIHRLAEGGIPDEKLWRVLEDFPGKVTAVHFTADGSRLVTASGVVGLGGVAAIWDVESGSMIRRFEGHRDLLFDAELSPDGKTLATCGYDRAIRLWDAESGQSLRTLEGHNGAVHDVAFSPDGRFLVSASADDTCKVWRVADGMRLDTLPQPLKEEYACAFSPDGRFIVAGGADNSIRVWEFVSRDEPKINPMVVARFAHEGPITRLTFTPDGSRLITAAEDRTLKVWETSDFTEAKLWDREPDVPTALAVAGDGRSFFAGRIDGSSSRYDLPPARERIRIGESNSPIATPPTAEVGLLGTATEAEPNDAADRANEIAAPAQVSGTISGRPSGASDVDLFRFSAKSGEEWVIEVDAARSGSKMDSFVEVLDARGDRIERVRLQAIRDSYFTFRGKDDAIAKDFRLFNWDEMHLDEYLYANGEVVKLWLYPRGPDSGYLVYPGEGKRWGYFDTTPLAHALGEPCYVVEPHPPGTSLIPNGLPVFSIFYENDDDSRRELGKDSRLTFTAPRDGPYLIRIRDVRGSEGPDHNYKLTIRHRRPDFRVKLGTLKLPVGVGDAQEFKASAERIDGYEGPIRIDIEGLPPGYSATSPLVIEAGQVEALGVIAAHEDVTLPLADPPTPIRAVASATIGGTEVSHPIKAPNPTPGSPKSPRLRLAIEPAEGGARPVGGDPNGPLEFEIRRGQTIMLKVTVEKSGFDGPVPLGIEGAGRNLPFGVYVDNIGLNGLLVTKEQSERTFFVTADRAATPQTRAFHLTTTVAGGHSSLPVILHVR